MAEWHTCKAVERDPEKLGGVWLFKGTRVPVSALFANLRDGASVDEFLEWFPGVEPKHVRMVLEHEVEALDESRAS